MKSRLSSFSLAICCLSIILVAALLSLRLLRVGVFVTGDSVDQITYQYLFSQQFWSGDHYPRWLTEANKGYGSPIFLAQYPFPYYLTALLRPVLSFVPSGTRESRELGVYCFLMLAVCGMAAWVWFRGRCTALASTVGAVVYMSLPYLLGMVTYYRVAVGELATFAWMPLLFAFCDRAETKRFRIMCGIAVAFALLLVSNVLTAILFTPALILYALASGRRTVFWVLGSLILGFCVAALYTLPLLTYRRLFTPDVFVVHRHFAELGRNLLYVTSEEIRSHRSAIPVITGTGALLLLIAYYVGRSKERLAIRLTLLVTLAMGALLLIPNLGPTLIEVSRLRVSAFTSYDDISMKLLLTSLFTLGLCLLAYCRISTTRIGPQERVLLMISCLAFFLMGAWSAGVWRVLPGTSIIQFPWRLCSILTVATVGIFAVCVDDCLHQDGQGRKGPLTILAISFALIAIFSNSLVWRVDIPFRSRSTPRVDITRWMDPMYLTYVPSPKLYAFAESVGASPDNYDVTPTPVKPGVSAEFTNGQGSVSIKSVTPERLLVSAQCDGDARVKISQLYFPLWKIVPAKGFANGGEVLGSSQEGLMEISLTPGQHEFWLVFGGGVPEKLGAVVSLASLSFIACGLVFVGFRHRRQKSSASEPLSAGQGSR